MVANRTPDDELEQAVRAYSDNYGNKAEAARALGLPYQTYKNRLILAEQRLGLKLGKVADGRIEQTDIEKLKLPSKGQRVAYFFTSAQNNTLLHPGFNNLVAYVDWYNNQEGWSAELRVGTFTYNKAAYGDKAVKRGTHEPDADGLWYAPEIQQYICDSPVEIAPGLIWCGEQNILPTAKYPLNGMEAYNGRASNIVPHSKMALDSVASMADEATKFNFATGAMTMRNYIQKRAGINAEQAHSYSALLIEVDDQGNWYPRHITVDRNDDIMDVGPDGFGGLIVSGGEVREDDVTLGINWGDAHASEMDGWVRELAWGKDGMLDTLRPRYQFMNDLFSMRSRSHHEDRNFLRWFEKHVDGEDSVAGELEVTADFLAEAERDWCETVVVISNHDRHLDRWANEADPRLYKDVTNARFWHLLNYRILQAVEEGERDFSTLEWSLRHHGDFGMIRFLAEDESFVIAKGSAAEPQGIEESLHGDLGPNGSRGSTRGLTKMGRAINKGHDHRAAIMDKVMSAGACALRFPYMKGPGSQSIAHIVTMKNGARMILIMWNGKWRA